jgi:hypothetical protein
MGISTSRGICWLSEGGEVWSRRSAAESQAVGLWVFQKPGANSLQISDAVHKAMAEIKPDMPVARGFRANKYAVTLSPVLTTLIAGKVPGGSDRIRSQEPVEVLWDFETFTVRGGSVSKHVTH